MAQLDQVAKRGRELRPSFFRFTPQRAIRELISETPSYSVSKPWAAISLIFWAFLDGRPGKRSDRQELDSDSKKAASKKTDSRNKDSKKRKIYTDDARRAGNIFLLLELHRLLAERSPAQDNERHEIMRMFEDTEGFANAVVGSSADELLESCRENTLDIKYTLEIVKYIVRYELLPTDKRTLEHAKRYVSQAPELADAGAESKASKLRRGVKKLEKIWAEYCAASPLLFALSCDPEFEYSLFNDIERVIDWTKKFCADHERVALFLGTAATVAKTLKKTGVRNARPDYFKKIEKTEVVVTPFTPEQMSSIKRIDPKFDRKDRKHYRPKVIKKKR